MEEYKAPQSTESESVPEGVLAEPDMQAFIEARNIQSESHATLVALSQIPKDTIIGGMHNFFSFYKGSQVLPALERSAAEASNEDQKRMYELFHSFTEQNDEYASRHLVTVLERRG